MIRRKGVWVTICVAWLLLLPSFTLAGQPKRLAVLEFQGKSSDAERLRVVTEAARVGALAACENQGVEVVSQEETLLILKNMAPCNTGEQCEIELGRTLQATFVVSGEIIQDVSAGPQLILKLHETEKGKMLGTRLLTLPAGEGAALVSPAVEDFVYDGLGKADVNVSGGDIRFAGNRKRIATPFIRVQHTPPVGSPLFDVEAERLVEEAQRIQESSTAGPEAKATAWCALAKKPAPNAYKDVAAQGCREWQQYAVARAGLEKELERDFEMLLTFLRLGRPTLDDKLKAMDTFLLNYRDLADNPRVGSVQAARTQSRLRNMTVMPNGEALPARPGTTPAKPNAGLDWPVVMLRVLTGAGAAVAAASLVAALAGVGLSVGTATATALVYGADKYRNVGQAAFYAGFIIAGVGPAVGLVSILLAAISLAASLRFP